jgi:hypothetical protein
MKSPVSLAALLLLTLAGCLSPITNRLDRLSQQMDAVEKQIDESNKSLRKLAGD